MGSLGSETQKSSLFVVHHRDVDISTSVSPFFLIVQAPSPGSYRPSFLFRLPHLHTIYVSKKRKVVRPGYVRERLETPDEDFMDLDWARAGHDRVVILLHGLEGSSDRPYIRGMAHMLNGIGWDAVAVNFRSCSGEPNRKPYSYHSGASHDLSTVIDRVQEQYDTMAGVGFSLGGNVLLKYLGESGTETPLTAGVAFSVPCDLKGSSLQLTSFSNKLYMWNFLRLLKDKVHTKAEMFPDLVDASGFESITSFREFDDRYTAPLSGFDSAEDYWEKSSSRRFIPGIKIPSLLVNAADDPFLSESCYPVQEAESNPHFNLEIPKYGGHVAFQQRGMYWSEQRVVHFLEHLR